MAHLVTPTALGGAVPRRLAPLATLNCIAIFVGMLGQGGVHKPDRATSLKANEGRSPCRCGQNTKTATHTSAQASIKVEENKKG